MPETLQRGEPLHQQIRNLYAGRIARGELSPGARLPSIRDMAELHGVAPGTAADAVKLLTAEKLVETLPGSGGTIVSAVTGNRLIFGPQQRLGYAGPVPGETTEVTAAGMVYAPDYVTAILSLEPVRSHEPAHVYRREQVTCDQAGTRIRLEVSWFHPQWAEVIPALASQTQPIPSLGGVAWLIAQATGDPVVRGKHGVEARPVLDDEREMPFLRLGPGDVVLAAVYQWDTITPAGRLETREYGEYIVPQGRVIEHDYDISTPVGWGLHGREEAS